VTEHDFDITFEHSVLTHTRVALCQPSIRFLLARDVRAYATMSVSVCLSVCLWQKCIGVL